MEKIKNEKKVTHNRSQIQGKPKPEQKYQRKICNFKEYNNILLKQKMKYKP